MLSDSELILFSIPKQQGEMVKQNSIFQEEEEEIIDNKESISVIYRSSISQETRF